MARKGMILLLAVLVTALLLTVATMPAIAGKAVGAHKSPAMDKAQSCKACHPPAPPPGIHKSPAVAKAMSCVVCH